MIIEAMGYLASITIMISLLMGNVVWLRVLNMIGCIFFTAYGFAIEAWPVVFLNGTCVFINLYHLWKLKKDDLRPLKVVKA
ncbi:uroporphyrinogen decarboxylase [Pseudovibrio exalbescens]|uniref:uroporphyrinogen decarboxylase n=1 Tax=Pseudovibrio exalbescens TaxID=197461 RepID=UPI002365591C|nr:uroporphyrinogen decarboxylase [Pseudovibrio exalbescens]MDD7911004.1 uroporphyrinogen decarboxylase [Pseudovibrio exalbescens]